jgi:hypothetical protein
MDVSALPLNVSSGNEGTRLIVIRLKHEADDVVAVRRPASDDEMLPLEPEIMEGAKIVKDASGFQDCFIVIEYDLGLTILSNQTATVDIADQAHFAGRRPSLTEHAIPLGDQSSAVAPLKDQWEPTR